MDGHVQALGNDYQGLLPEILDLNFPHTNLPEKG